MRHRRNALALVLVGLSLAGGSAGARPSSGSEIVANASKSCSGGYVHAVMPNGHKCLRRGQFCSRKRNFQRRYHRYGFHCKRNGHLGYY